MKMSNSQFFGSSHGIHSILKVLAKNRDVPFNVSYKHFSKFSFYSGVSRLSYVLLQNIFYLFLDSRVKIRHVLVSWVGSECYRM